MKDGDRVVIADPESKWYRRSGTIYDVDSTHPAGPFVGVQIDGLLVGERRFTFHVTKVTHVLPRPERPD